MTKKKLMPAAVLLAALIVMAAGAFAQSYMGDEIGPPPDKVDLIFKAASTGDLETLNLTLNMYPELVNARDAAGRTPVHRAAMVGKTKAVEMILDRGAEVNPRDNHKKTPYYYARIARFYETAKLLRYRGGKL